MIGLPFALVCTAILVYAVLLLERTLSESSEAPESDEEGHGDPMALFATLALAAAFLVALYSLTARADRLEHSPENCARRLGIAYSIDQGATEQLDAFERCVR